jgi:hypothetical protein
MSSTSTTGASRSPTTWTPNDCRPLPPQATALGDALVALAAAVTAYRHRIGRHAEAWTLIGVLTCGRCTPQADQQALSRDQCAHPTATTSTDPTDTVRAAATRRAPPRHHGPHQHPNSLTNNDVNSLIPNGAQQFVGERREARTSE